MTANRAAMVTAPPIHGLSISSAFQSLTPQEKLYAHYLSRLVTGNNTAESRIADVGLFTSAAWHGTRIILRQVSPESIGIFDFIIKLYDSCSGNWKVLVEETGVTVAECDAFLDYAATFLSNIGNYYGTGDQKFVPRIEHDSLEKFARRSPELKALFSEISSRIFSTPPYSLGYPGDQAQSAYYPGDSQITKDEIATISKFLEEMSIFPENTRIRKLALGQKPTFEVLQASIEKDTEVREFPLPGSKGLVRLVRGDHSEELKLICSALSNASKYAANNTQKLFISQHIESFKTGSLDVYRDSQRTWVKDKSPSVENIFGFVEPYRDPCGIRAEFEGLVAITDKEKTKVLQKLVEHSAQFIRLLPWANRGSTENGGKGPFEKALFEPPDFTSLYALAYCSSIIFPGINLPNYNDIRQERGFKNVIITNRISTESNEAETCAFIEQSEGKSFQRHKYPTYYWWVVLHELLGHGTGKMMIQEGEHQFNFDINAPPVNPLTGKPISTWYKPGQTWTGQFGDLATTVDECRAELVGAYLMDNKELLGLFGYNEKSKISAEDITYNLYLQLGVDGLRGLANFNIDDFKWGQAHSRAHFATLKCLLIDGGGFMTVEFNPQQQRLIVRVDRSKIISHGKPALGQMLLRLHMYRCTADVQSCRAYYEDLSKVDGEYLEWRKVVLANITPRWVFVQANTFLDNGNVILKEYEASKKGVIQSWYERRV